HRGRSHQDDGEIYPRAFAQRSALSGADGAASGGRVLLALIFRKRRNGKAARKGGFFAYADLVFAAHVVERIKFSFSPRGRGRRLRFAAHTPANTHLVVRR